MITIAYLFFWDSDFNDMYFTKFIKYHFGEVKEVKIEDNPDILFVSVLGGNIASIKDIKAKIKIFFTGENLSYNPYHHQFNDNNVLKENFDIITGFKYDYDVRIPLWIIYYDYYDYDESTDNIIKYIQSSYDKNKNNKEFFCTLISRNKVCQNNLRPYLYKFISRYGKVICAGSLFNNHNEKIPDTPADKIKHISKSIFNICPENSNGEAYFTEKLIQALEAGTIPIYWSSEIPEANIINRNKYIFCDINNIEKFEKLLHEAFINNEVKQTYIDGDVFTKEAGIHIKKIYDDLKNNIKKQLDEKNIPYELRIT